MFKKSLKKCALIAATLGIAVTPAFAGSAGINLENTSTVTPGGRLNIQWQNVYNVEYDINKIVTETVLANLNKINGTAVKLDRCGNAHTFYAEIIASDAELCAAFETLYNQFMQDFANVPGRTYVKFADHKLVGQEQIVVSECSSFEYLGSEISTERTFDEQRSSDAIVIGDPSDLCNYYVAQGQVDLTITDTTTETQSWNQHIDRTVQNIAYYCYEMSAIVSPILLDLDSDGAIGASQGQYLSHAPLEDHSEYRLFDFNGNGFPVFMEWVGSNDGILYMSQEDGIIDGKAMFGSAGGYRDGYQKLSTLDANEDGVLTGAELEGLRVWQDKNRNAIAEAGETRSVQELGITEIGVNHNNMVSHFVREGKKEKTFDWWPNMYELKQIDPGKTPYAY